MTKAEREKAKSRAGESVMAELAANSDSAAWAASRDDDWTHSRTYHRERARLYRVALRAVREEVRRGK